MQIFLHFAIVLTQFSFVIGIGICSCEELKIQFECENLKIIDTCLWEGDHCRQKLCNDIIVEEKCNFISDRSFNEQNSFSVLNKFKEIECYWDGIACQEFTICEQINTTQKKTLFPCYSKGCLQSSDGSSCNTPTFTECIQIKDPLLCDNINSNNLNCQFVENLCRKRSSYFCESLSLDKCMTNEQIKCAIRNGICTNLECRDIQSSNICNEIILNSGECYYKNEQCYPMNSQIQCSDIRSSTKCNKQEACIWKSDICQYKQCEDYSCIYKQPRGYIGNGIIFCKSNDFGLCVAATQCEVFMEDCASSTSFTYSWDENYCRQCHISFEPMLSFLICIFIGSL